MTEQRGTLWKYKLVADARFRLFNVKKRKNTMKIKREVDELIKRDDNQD